MQPYSNNEKNQLLKRVVIEAKRKNIASDTEAMSREVIGSPFFGYMLYDEGVLPIIKNIDRDFFASNYLAIIKAMASAGVYDSYLLLIDQIIGPDSMVRFVTPKPGHLQIYIWSISSSLFGVTTKKRKGILTRNKQLIAVRVSVEDFTLNQLEKVMQILATSAGIYLDVIFKNPNE